MSAISESAQSKPRVPELVRLFFGTEVSLVMYPESLVNCEMLAVVISPISILAPKSLSRLIVSPLRVSPVPATKLVSVETSTVVRYPESLVQFEMFAEVKSAVLSPEIVVALWSWELSVIVRTPVLLRLPSPEIVR